MNRLRVFFMVLSLVMASAAGAWAAAPQRIITVGGAVTEIVYALGAEDLIVGSDTTSYFPPAAAKLPKVGYMRALSAEGILSLRPDLLIVTEDAGPPPVLHQLDTAGVRMLRLKSGRSVADVEDSIRRLAKVLERVSEGADLLAKLTRDKATLSRMVAGGGKSQRVMFILQHGGGAPMVAGGGTAADGIIRLSGAENAVAGYGGYKPLTPEAAVALRPDAILITDQGLKQAGGRDALLAVPGLALTPAGRHGRVYSMDALLLLGFGPRTVEAAMALNRMYHEQ